MTDLTVTLVPTMAMGDMAGIDMAVSPDQSAGVDQASTDQAMTVDQAVVDQTVPADMVDGSVVYTLTVSKANYAVGTNFTVTSSAGSCTGGCSCNGTACPMSTQTFPPGTTVTLSGTTTNGSGYYFQGWSGLPTGTDSRHTVSFPMNASYTVTAQFDPITSNLVFVSSTMYMGNLGSALSVR